MVDVWKNSVDLHMNYQHDEYKLKVNCGEKRVEGVNGYIVIFDINFQTINCNQIECQLIISYKNFWTIPLYFGLNIEMTRREIQFQFFGKDN